MESFPGVAVSTDSADKDIMKRNPSKLSEPIISKKQRMMMIIDGIVFGLSIAAGYILTYHYVIGQGSTIEQAQLMAGTVSFAITLFSPQIYVFILREGNLFEKFKRRNLMLKSFFVFTFLMILAIIYLPAFNTLFTTTPVFDPVIWGLILVFSFLTTAFRALFGEHVFFSQRDDLKRSVKS
jgi:magnesium-transporting ATPase (P-type)